MDDILRIHTDIAVYLFRFAAE